jgi:hypothetical protein
VLTGNGIQFTNQARQKYAFHHIFDRICDENGIEYRLTKLNHPWSFEEEKLAQWTNSPKNGQVERLHPDDHNQLRRHLQDFINTCNFGRRLKTLKGLSPDEFICKRWTSEPERFIIDPTHQVQGLNSYLHQATITRLRPSFLAR